MGICQCLPFLKGVSGPRKNNTPGTLVSGFSIKVDYVIFNPLKFLLSGSSENVQNVVCQECSVFFSNISISVCMC